jgi:hypothetical protein
MNVKLVVAHWGSLAILITGIVGFGCSSPTPPSSPSTGIPSSSGTEAVGPKKDPPTEPADPSVDWSGLTGQDLVRLLPETLDGVKATARVPKKKPKAAIGLYKQDEHHQMAINILIFEDLSQAKVHERKGNEPLAQVQGQERLGVMVHGKPGMQYYYNKKSELQVLLHGRMLLTVSVQETDDHGAATKLAEKLDWDGLLHPKPTSSSH